MISNIILGTDNLDKAEGFYTPIMTLLGATKSQTTDRTIVWSFGKDTTGFAVSTPFDSKPASSGNGTMVGITTSSKEIVDEAYSIAIQTGGTCEGQPGNRNQQVYAAYFRDPSGNKVGLFFKK